MDTETIIEVLEILKRASSVWREPIVSELAGKTRDPFKVLISTVLSLRTRDETTAAASRRLFDRAGTPGEIAALKIEELEKLIYPVGFYRNKSKSIIGICQVLIEKYGGKVPDTLDELLEMNGVGRKTANLVITVGYGKPGICVDTHVHRISNRFGYLKSDTPLKTEFALREKLPGKYWIEYNDLLVTLGQNICHPISPKCTKCPVSGYCGRVGVVRSR